MSAAEWEAWCDATAADDEPPASDENEVEPDPEPGEWIGQTSGFAAGNPLDALPGGGTLAFFADLAAGDDDRYAGVSDDELDGVIAAWDRVEAYACARKHAAVAEFIRRRADPDAVTGESSAMPLMWDEFAVDELRMLFAEHRGAAEELMSRSHDLAVKLPGTMGLFGAGRLRESRVKIMVFATAPLDPAEARAVEELVLGRAGRLTPGGLREAVARAVMEVAPEKARKRREAAQKDARVQRWAEDSGNAALMGRELPPAEVLAADQRITAWARELRSAGLEGGLDELRARAYLDLLLGKDSRPQPGQDSGPAAPGGSGTSGSGETDGSGGGGPAGPRVPGRGGPRAGVVPAGFAVRGTLTVPLVTLAQLADRPGVLGGIGTVDPWLARDLAAAAALHPKTTWCVTVADLLGHAVAHGCARPAPKGRGKPGGPGGTRDGPGGFSFTPAGRDGPRGGYGTWRLRTPGDGPDLIIELYPLGTDPCDHRFQANGHDPGVRLRHLAQVRHATCTGPVCRRPAAGCDFEHNTPYEAGGRTCLCNAGPKCRHDHRLKQQSRWKVEQLADGTFRWTTPSGRSYITEPTRYPI